MNRTSRDILSETLSPCTVIDCLSGNAVIYKPGMLVRTLRGSKMQSRQALMDEFGAALQFFDGFGENWNALEECLKYLDEWLPADVYTLEVTHPHLLLQNEPEQLQWFFKIMDEVHDWWSKPIVDNGRYNRPAVPFHVVLRASEAECEATQRRFPGVPVLLPETTVDGS